MTDVPYPTDIERLEDNIRNEIRAQNGMGGLELDDAMIARLASSITANVDYAFEFSWHPRWVKGGDAHRWAEESEVDGQRHFVECLQCKRITVHPTSESADRWYVEHQRDEHA